MAKACFGFTLGFVTRHFGCKSLLLTLPTLNLNLDKLGILGNSIGSVYELTCSLLLFMDWNKFLSFSIMTLMTSSLGRAHYLKNILLRMAISGLFKCKMMSEVPFGITVGKWQLQRKSIFSFGLLLNMLFLLMTYASTKVWLNPPYVLVAIRRLKTGNMLFLHILLVCPSGHLIYSHLLMSPTKLRCSDGFTSVMFPMARGFLLIFGLL